MPAPITDKKRAAILADLRHGHSTDQIIFKHHCSTHTITQIKMRYGLKSTRPLAGSVQRLEQIKKAIMAGSVVSDMIIKFHCGYDLIKKIRLTMGLPAFCRGRRLLITNEKQQLITKLLQAGEPMAHIARAADVCTKTVANLRDRLNGVDRNIQLDAKRRGERI